MADVREAKRARTDGEEDGSAWVVPAEDVIRIRFVEDETCVLRDDANRRDSEEDGDAGSWVCPEFTHQVFGQEEVVKGYEEPRVDVYLDDLTLCAFVRISYKKKLDDADDIEHALKETLGLEYSTDPQAFVDAVRRKRAILEESLPRDAKVCASLENGIEILRFKPSESDDLRDWHDRMQPMPLLYIDGANYIDNCDSRWDVYVAIARSEGASKHRSLAGFSTLYSFFAYPDRRRFRVSQILSFPGHRRCGIASSILEAIYSDASLSSNKVVDVTVEDPSDSFQWLRERKDYQRICSFSPFFSKVVRDQAQNSKQMIDNGIRPETLLLPKREVYDKAQLELKMHKLQFRKVWEILLMKEIAGSLKWSNANDVVRAVVKCRLANDEEEKKLKEASTQKQVFETGGSEFFMVKAFNVCPSGMIPGSEAQAQDGSNEGEPEEEQADPVDLRMDQLSEIMTKL